MQTQHDENHLSLLEYAHGVILNIISNHRGITALGSRGTREGMTGAPVQADNIDRRQSTKAHFQMEYTAIHHHRTAVAATTTNYVIPSWHDIRTQNKCLL